VEHWQRNLCLQSLMSFKHMTNVKTLARFLVLNVVGVAPALAPAEAEIGFARRVAEERCRVGVLEHP
jgi:hypothetical protein